MYQATVTTLQGQGFEIYRRTNDAVYMRKGPDHRVVMMKDGSMKRGRPEYRGK